MSASTPSAIVSAIRPAFDKGKESGDLLFFPSQIHTHKDLAIDVGPNAPHFPSPITSTQTRARINNHDFVVSSRSGYARHCCRNPTYRPRTLSSPVPRLSAKRRREEMCSSRRTIRTFTLVSYGTKKRAPNTSSWSVGWFYKKFEGVL
jgi:hypothetical protein